MKIKGLPVRNATKKVKIVIAPQDCKFGSSKEPGSCAAARAALRQVPRCSEVRIHLSRSYLRVGNVWFRYITPDSLRGEIVTFDRGGKFDAGEYYFNPMSKSHRKRMGKAQGSKPKHPRGRPGHQRAKYHRIEGVREMNFSESGYEKEYD